MRSEAVFSRGERWLLYALFLLVYGLLAVALVRL